MDSNSQIEKKHESHVTRGSDSSYYDEVCTICGATDITGGGWGALGKICLGLPESKESSLNTHSGALS